MKALLSKDRALGLKTKARWLIYNCIRLWLVRISKNLIISCHTHNLSWQITYIYVWFEMRKLRPRASLLYHFLKSTGVRVKIPDLLPTQLSKQQYPLSRNRNKNPWPANLTGMFVVRSNEIYMNMLWKCHNTLYKKKDILLPFKNHENNIALDNYAHRAFPHCQTDKRMFKATKRSYLDHLNLKIRFCQNPSFTFW